MKRDERGRGEGETRISSSRIFQNSAVGGTHSPRTRSSSVEKGGRCPENAAVLTAIMKVPRFRFLRDVAMKFPIDRRDVSGRGGAWKMI